MLSITISQIKYLIALQESGSFSEAANACYVTQSTLSTMIKKMEDQVGFKLFDRKSKPIQLTDNGTALLEQFKIVKHEFARLEEMVRGIHDELSGNLKIGIIPTLAPFLVPLFLEKIVKDHPEINFSIYEITTAEICNNLRMREIDVGILSIPLNEKDLVTKSLFTEDFLLYDSRENVNTKRKYRVDEIDISRLWLMEESHCMTNQIEKICQLRKSANFDRNLEYKSGSILSLIHLVSLNKGLTLLPRLATMNETLINQNNIANLASPRPAREIGVVTHRNFAKDKLLNILEKEILKAVKPHLNRARKLQIIQPF